jgi:NAD(P)-dependent dehydrogenase (short-subunit alcohol dehydrogenase family)
MTRSLILGGTRGLGKMLAVQSLERGIIPVVLGRSVETAAKDPALAGAEFAAIDLTDPSAAESVAGQVWRGDVSHIFWVAGVHQVKPLAESAWADFQLMNSIHFLGPLAVLRTCHRLMLHSPARPYHLVVIASTSSWRMRDNETLYCSLKAAKAHFARNFSRELDRDLPGSRVTLINPGGMATELFQDGRDVSMYMSPQVVAECIWSQVAGQQVPFEEIHIMRDDDGSPRLEFGQKAPEAPF